MIAIKGINEEQIARLYENFKKKYKDQYGEAEWEYIEDNFWTYVFEPASCDILMQVYQELNIQHRTPSFYQRHLKRIKKRFDITGNILDVGSGIIPSFANMLAYEQLKLGKGTITLYEPQLLTTTPKYHNMTLHKEKFTEDTHIKEFDLITGIMPCAATESIVKAACKNRKDFYIAMCGCTHFENYYLYNFNMVSPERYQDYVIELTEDLLREYDNGTLVVERLERGFPIDYPILYNRKK